MSEYFFGPAILADRIDHKRDQLFLRLARRFQLATIERHWEKLKVALRFARERR